MDEPNSAYLKLLKNRIDLKRIPFSDRGSRILVFFEENQFSIRLAERWIKRDHRLAAYRQRRPLIENFCFLDERGVPLELSLTTYPHCIFCDTRLGRFTIFFADPETLQIILPSTKCGISFLGHLNLAYLDRRGGRMHLTGDIRRNVSYTTNALIKTNQVQNLTGEAIQIHLQVSARAGDSILLNITPRLGFNRSIQNPMEKLQTAEQTWHSWFAAAPKPVEEYQNAYYYAWWVMRAGLISTRYYISREAMTPSKEYYVGVWQWDALFHALAYRHIDARLAQDQIRILLDHQQADGMIPDAIHDEGLVTALDFPIHAHVTKPPLIAWASLHLFESAPDLDFLQEIYEPLKRWNSWWFEKNDIDQDGLCEYLHPFSSGMDNHPLWDEGMPVTSPDLNTYLALQAESLAKIASLIGEKKDQRHFKRLSEEVSSRMMKKLWNKEEGFFYALQNGRRIPCRSVTGLFPILNHNISSKITQRLVNHLLDPQLFWTKFPVPSVAIHDPRFDPQDMWRGPTWVNVNYLLIEGLRNRGFVHIARQLRSKTLDMIASLKDMYEYYNPLNGDNPPKAASTFGWTAALFIDMVCQLAGEKEGDDV